MKLVTLFILIFVLDVLAQAPNAPAQFTVTNYNGYVKLSWRNPYPLSTYTSVQVWREGDISPLITYYNNDDGNLFGSHIINEARHQKNNYYLIAKNFKYTSPQTEHIPGWAIRTIYIHDGDVLGGDGSGNDAVNPINISVFQTSNSGEGWRTYNWGDSKNGFYKGDSIYIVGTINNYVNTLAAIYLPSGSSTPKFPLDVYTNQPSDYSQNLVFTGYPNSGTITPANNAEGFNTNGCSNLTIQNLHLDGVNGKSLSCTTGCWIINAVRSSNLIIANNYFDFTKGNGCIKIQGGDIDTTPYDAKNIIVRDNTVYQGNAVPDKECNSEGKCYDKVWGGDGDFIQLGLIDSNTDADVDNISIYRNTITFRNGYTGSGTQGPEPPHTDMIQAYRLKSNSKIYIYQNYFKWIGTRIDDGTQGIHATSTVSGTGEIWVWNNIFYFYSANNAININNYDENITGYIKLFAYNNTFYKANAGYKGSYFVQIQKPVTGNEIENNIFYSEDNLTDENFYLLAFVNSSSASHTINYNLYHSNKIGVNQYYLYYNGSKDWNQWKSLTFDGNSDGSISGNIPEPQFSETPPIDGSTYLDFAASSTDYVVGKATPININGSLLFSNIMMAV